MSTMFALAAFAAAIAAIVVFLHWYSYSRGGKSRELRDDAQV